MRLSPRRLLILAVTVPACLVAAASPAFAQDQPPAVTLSSCDRQVCETVTAVSSSDLRVGAAARTATCGRFEVRVTTPTDVVDVASGISCVTNPTWWTDTMLPRSAISATVRVRYVSTPETLGEPLVSFSSLTAP
jgi:hypothetical protein